MMIALVVFLIAMGITHIALPEEESELIIGVGFIGLMGLCVVAIILNL